MQGNSGNLVYIKSTDDSMLETLQTLAGMTHLSYRDNKSVTLDSRRQFNQADSKVTISASVHEVPVISKSEMLNVPRANMMIFGKGHPIWDRNQTMMPFAYALQGDNTLRDFENNVKYSLPTVPTTASTEDFEVKTNMPNFYKMVSKRVHQARKAKEIRERYKVVYGTPDKPLTDFQLNQMDGENLAKQLMQGINEELYNESAKNKHEEEVANNDDTPSDAMMAMMSSLEQQQASANDVFDADAEKLEAAGKENTEVKRSQAETDQIDDELSKPRYGGGRISRKDLDGGDTQDNLADAYVKSIKAFQKFGGNGFHVDEHGSLWYGGTLFVASNVNTLEELLSKGNTINLPGNGPQGNFDASSMVTIKPAFISWIKKQDSLAGVCSGELDRAFGEAYARREDMNLSRSAG